jgi:hypothetical protein
MFTEHQQLIQQMPISTGTSEVTTTVLPSRFAQTSGEIVPTLTEQSTASQMIYTPGQLLTISGMATSFTD